MILVGNTHGISVLYGSIFLSGIIVIIMSPFFSYLVKLFPPVVTGSVVTIIGITLMRSEEHTSELQSRFDLVCRLLLEKKKITTCTKESLGLDKTRVKVECGVCRYSKCEDSKVCGE